MARWLLPCNNCTLRKGEYKFWWATVLPHHACSEMLQSHTARKWWKRDLKPGLSKSNLTSKLLYLLSFYENVIFFFKKLKTQLIKLMTFNQALQDRSTQKAGGNAHVSEFTFVYVVHIHKF